MIILFSLFFLLISCAAFYLLVNKLNIQFKYFALAAFSLANLFLIFFDNYRSYPIFAIPFLLIGIYLIYEEKYLISAAFFGLAIGIDYYVAFAFFPILMASNQKYYKKILSLIIALLPIWIIYIIEHFIFPESYVCRWIPDFQLWNDLFDLNYLMELYWFWIWYAFILAGSVFIGVNNTKKDMNIWCGYLCMCVFVVTADLFPDYLVLLVPFLTIIFFKNVTKHVSSILLFLVTAFTFFVYDLIPLKIDILQRIMNAVGHPVLYTASVLGILYFLYDSYKNINASKFDGGENEN